MAGGFQAQIAQYVLYCLLQYLQLVLLLVRGGDVRRGVTVTGIRLLTLIINVERYKLYSCIDIHDDTGSDVPSSCCVVPDH